ncbi:DUF1800 domain-containing protein [Ideonella sp. DXS22W]|uniref:DUF1800 domain-containing protein n=1 Tax=Pseudaquabacterium inlustre TaxID=2984192 RepID=A0ABU9CJZ2_9BURK
MTAAARTLAATVAAHRFGLGEADTAALAPDAAGWLRAQIGPADAPLGEALPDFAQALRVQATARRLREPEAERALRQQVLADQQSRLLTALRTRRPFAERLQLFWCNHFTVSLAKGAAQGLVGAFEREAIRPHIAGRFADLLAAAVTHPTMLRYLDNQGSAGPQSAIVQRVRRRGERSGQAPRLTGLNENLAREVLELHTLGVARSGDMAGADATYGPMGGYGQADVTAFAAVLTGWRGPVIDGDAASAPGTRFDADWHQPGDKVVLGRRHAEGPQALRAVLDDLARHPATARHIALKLARHLVADQPPPALVARLAQRFTDSDGDLPAVYAALIDSPEAWAAPPQKLKSPEEFLLSAGRLLTLDERAARRLAEAGAPALNAMGQRLQAAPSPAGWPDRADEWLGPEALWQRVAWSRRWAERAGAAVDARALAAASLGPWLGDTARQQIARAADGQQALALLWLAPEFQRR